MSAYWSEMSKSACLKKEKEEEKQTNSQEAKPRLEHINAV